MDKFYLDVVRYGFSDAVIFLVLWFPYNMMSMVAHMINEHRLNITDVVSSSYSVNLTLQIAFYASRAFVFLYFFIWPLNYFIRFPNFRLLLRNNSGYELRRGLFSLTIFRLASRKSYNSKSRSYSTASGTFSNEDSKQLKLVMSHYKT